MNKIQKRKLYESIMRSVSKTVKRKLNEADDSFENNEIYTYLHDMFETAEKYNQVFQKDKFVKLFGYNNMKLQLPYSLMLNIDDYDIECYDIDSLETEFNNNPDAFSDIKKMRLSFFISNDEDDAKNDRQKYFTRMFPNACESIAKKFGYEFDDDGYHLSIYSNYELETIGDLENTIDEVLNIYKELYIRAGSIAHKAILTILHMKS